MTCVEAMGRIEQGIWDNPRIKEDESANEMSIRSGKKQCRNGGKHLPILRFPVYQSTFHIVYLLHHNSVSPLSYSYCLN
jgi:hypothetical protein